MPRLINPDREPLKLKAVRLPESLLSRVHAVAIADERTVEAVMRRMLEAALPDYETALGIVTNESPETNR